MTKIALTASVVSVLLDYDGPQLLALKSNRGFKMLAVAVKHAGFVRPFFACELRDSVSHRYFDAKIDLHYTFKQAVGRAYYLFDLKNSGREAIALTKAKEQDVENDDYWPATGFFSDEHENPFELEVIPATSTRKYFIDGNWEAPDFSRFHGKMSEIYSLFASIERFSGPSGAEERGYISAEISERYWQGGGSYGGFFDSLESRNLLVTRNPLRVDAISYASPGKMIFRGNDAALGAVENLIEVFEERFQRLREQYRFIYGVLRKEKLLSAKRNATFSSRALRETVRDRSRQFAEDMALERVDDIYELSGRNVLVFAKVVLSIFRRAEAVYQFHAEGRVQSSSKANSI